MKLDEMALVKMARKVEALETTVQQQGQMIESLKRQIVMFIGFVDTVGKFMISTGVRMEKLESDDHKPKLEVIRQ
jgi:hypothetical protein